MLKGVNKKVVEVVNPENECFERVIFILKDSASRESEAHLAQKAAKYIDLVKKEAPSATACTVPVLPKARQFSRKKLVLLAAMILVIAGILLTLLLL